MVCARFMDYEAVWAQALGSTAPHGRRLHRAPYFKALVPGGYTFDLEAEGNFHVTNAAQPWALLDNSGAGAAAAEADAARGRMDASGGRADAAAAEADAAGGRADAAAAKATAAIKTMLRLIQKDRAAVHDDGVGGGAAQPEARSVKAK